MARVYTEAQRKRINERGKQWKKDNPEKVKASTKAYNKANKEKKAAANKKWKDNNKERKAELNKNWQQNNKARMNAHTNRYRQQKEDNNYILTELHKLVEHELYDIAQKRTKQTGFPWEVDHIQPISKGGRHSIENLQVVPRTWNRQKCNRNSNIYRRTA